MSVMLMYSKCLSLCIDRADVVESRQKTWNTVCIFHAWRRRLAHMLGIALRMVPRALSGAPVGTTGIGNVAVSAMLGRGGGRGARTGGINSGNSAIAETNGGQAKQVTATALTCEASGGGPSCGGLESFLLGGSGNWNVDAAGTRGKYCTAAWGGGEPCAAGLDRTAMAQATVDVGTGLPSGIGGGRSRETQAGSEGGMMGKTGKIGWVAGRSNFEAGAVVATGKRQGNRDGTAGLDGRRDTGAADRLLGSGAGDVGRELSGGRDSSCATGAEGTRDWAAIGGDCGGKGAVSGVGAGMAACGDSTCETGKARGCGTDVGNRADFTGDSCSDDGPTRNCVGGTAMTRAGADIGIVPRGRQRDLALSGQRGSSGAGGTASRGSWVGIGKGHKASGDGVHGTITAYVTAGVGAGPSRDKLNGFSSGQGGGRSACANGSNAELRTGEGIGEMGAATGALTGNIGRASLSGGIGGAADRDGAGTGAGSNGVIGAGTGGPTAGVAISGSVAGRGEADSAGSGKAGAMGAGGVQAGAGIGGGTIPSGSNSMGIRLWAGCRAGGIKGERGAGAGVRGGQTWMGDGGEAAGNCCGRTGTSGTFDGADDRTWSAAWASITVGAGNWGDKGVMGAAGGREGGGAKGTGSGGNEACRGDCVWTSCCGYTSRMVALKLSQVPGSGKASRVRVKVSHIGPSV